MGNGFAIRRFETPTGSWTPITTPIECSRMVIENGNTDVAMAVRTTQGDSSTEKTIPPGQELTIQAVATFAKSGDTVLYINPASGNGPAVVSYTR